MNVRKLKFVQLRPGNPFGPGCIVNKDVHAPQRVRRFRDKMMDGILVGQIQVRRDDFLVLLFAS